MSELESELAEWRRISDLFEVECTPDAVGKTMYDISKALIAAREIITENEAEIEALKQLDSERITESNAIIQRLKAALTKAEAIDDD